VTDLTQALEVQTSEMDSLRKKGNREVSLSNGMFDSKALPPKSDLFANREEIAGLK
jgi:hypothetical protein